jgi:hypothetical protein
MKRKNNRGSTDQGASTQAGRFDMVSHSAVSRAVFVFLYYHAIVA